ncbi:hypothetical protein SCHPADRAFT_942602 [Schizopora paradoxa]|uniref:FAD-binding FR-type domain-containing protein n=1 Tax=Schizopora paradoxa TaxID=27342 RepID=A0A0H2RFX5_9AGAM|nr:hypothetical protein SCHPADRAFT_942602 [Schizopora paradoxa]
MSTNVSTTPPSSAADGAIRNGREALYPQEVWWMISCTIALLISLRAISWLWNYRKIHSIRQASPTTTPANDVELQTKPPNNVNPLMKAGLSVLSLTRILAFRFSYSIGYGSRISLAEALTPAAYLAALLTWELINTRDLSGVEFSTKYWANRAGAMAASQLTFVVALAGKNNIISFLTGISYEKLHIIHRAAARSLLVLIFIHLSARKKLGFVGDDSLTIGWIRCGIAAGSALTTLVILGNRYIRSKMYEGFLIIHHFFVLIILCCLIPHAGSGGYAKFVWPALLLWGLDRLLRLSRIIYSTYLQHRTSIPTKASIEVLSSDALRVTVTLRRSKLLHWRPGQSVHLCVPVASPFWHPFEFHPFTIATIPTDVSIASKSDVEKAMHDDNMQMKFIIRARDGFTARLHHYAWDSAVNAGRGRDPRFVKAYLDGPYGAPPSVDAFQNLVCIAGGSGVSFTLPLLMDVVRRNISNPQGLLCRRVLFVWSIRDIEDLDWIASDLRKTLSSVSSSLEVEVCVFVTGTRRGIAMNSTTSVKETVEIDTKNLLTLEKNAADRVEEAQTSDSEHATKFSGGDADALLRDRTVSVSSGRAQVTEILAEESRRSEGSSMLVCVSGPTSLATSVRSALCKSSIAGVGAAMRGTNVSLHVEGFAVA